MNLQIFEIPDESKELTDWLERQLVGLTLGQLVAELHVIHGNPVQHSIISLEDIFKEFLSDVLESGLASLPAGKAKLLLKHPQLLIELQESIFENGGAYWQTVSISDEHREIAERCQSRLRESLPSYHTDLPSKSAEGVAKVANDVDENSGVLQRHASERPELQSMSTEPKSIRRFPLGFLAALAASVLLLIGYLNWPPGGGSSWGFEKAGLLTAKVSGSEYLDSLADAAAMWENKRPDTKVPLAQRLVEFRRGCDLLIKAPNSQLSDVDRNWLVERCQVWGKKIDSHLNDLQNDQKTVSIVLAEADMTVEALIKALRERAMK